MRLDRQQASRSENSNRSLIRPLFRAAANSRRSDELGATLIRGNTRMQTAVRRHIGRIGIGLAMVAIAVCFPPAVDAVRPDAGTADASAAAPVDADKAAAFNWIDRNADEMKALGTELWGTPELSFREFK